MKPPQPGGAVYVVARQHRLPEVHHVHQSMFKPVHIYIYLWVVVGPKDARPGRVQAALNADPVIYPVAPAAVSPESSIGASAGPRC